MARERTVAESMLRALKSNGVDYLFSNLGSDHPPILEAVARAREGGDRDRLPEIVICPHEFAAVSAAHGYAAATGRPQGVLVHVDVGTLNAGGAIHNAHRANVPLFVLAGLAPVTEGGYAGSRDSTVHYVQDVPDQLDLVEQYCRWTAEYRLPADPEATVRRGIERATAPPGGPVYVAAAREALEATDYAGSDRAPAAREVERPSADDGTLRALAAAIERADRPVVITSHLGRNPEAVRSLVSFAEAAGAGVVEHRPTALSFPRDHELHLGYEPTAAFDRADLLVITACDVPWIPSKGTPDEDCRVVQVDPDPTKPAYPQWDFDVDTTVTGSGDKVLPALEERIDPDAGRTGRREWASVAEDRRREDERRLASERDRDQLTPAVLSDALDAVVDESTIVVDDAVTSKSAVLAHLDLTAPGSYHMKGGSALGWAPGAAVGVKMANPDERVIALSGDGAYVFANPTASAWLAAQRDAPILTVIYDNGGWNAVKKATTGQHPEGRASDDEVPESRFETTLDLSVPAGAVDAFTRRVTTRGELEDALVDAVDAIESGTPATLDVVLERM